MKFPIDVEINNACEEGKVLTLSAYHVENEKAYRCNLEVHLGPKQRLRILNICLQETDA